VSACVLRGIRSDFDKVAQAAVLRWRWNPTVLDGQPVGVAMTVSPEPSGLADAARACDGSESSAGAPCSAAHRCDEPPWPC
jgi:hypothetical protein